MLNYKTIILLLGGLLLSSCATLFHHHAVQPAIVSIAPGQTVKLPLPRELPFNLSATQILTASYHIKNKTQTVSTQVQVEKHQNHLVLVAVAGWGGQIFSIDYNGSRIKTSSLPMPNVALGINHVLSDFIFTYAPPALIKKMLRHTTITFKQSEKSRLFLLHKKPIITIRYQNKNPWRGNVILKNKALHYTITIQTITVKKETTY